MSVHNSNFIKNDAIQHGRAIFLNEGNLKIYDSIFEENKGLNGGAINQPCGSMTLKNCSFNNNYSKNGSKGLIYTNGNIEESGNKFKKEVIGVFFILLLSNSYV